MIISEIYTEYKIMPSLQQHMYRVAGVAQMICTNSKEKVDTDNIIAAALLHDMGNILKFNLELFPEFLEPEGFEYWQKAKAEFKEKYGEDEHEATLEIAQELQVSSRIYDLINWISFSKAEENYKKGDMGIHIAEYSDMRVKPQGVTTLDERLVDGRKRFIFRDKPDSNPEFFERMTKYLKKIEQRIFEKSFIHPQDITESAIEDIMESLTTFNVG